MEKAGLKFSLPVVCDHQLTGTLQECERMVYYKHGLGRTPIREEYALTWGKVFHKVVEIWSLTKSLPDVIAFIDANVPEDSQDRYGRNRGRMVELFTAWMVSRNDGQIEVLRTEQPITLTCDAPCPYSENGCFLTYGGRLDEIARWQQYVGPLDIKTTVMDESDPVTIYRPNHQMAGYIWLTAHLTGNHPWGVIVERAVCNKSKLNVKRFPVPYSKDLIREWIENEKELQARLKYLAENHPYDETKWMQNHSRCSQPYVCQFRDVCLAPRDMDFRLRVLRDNTTDKRWDFNNPDGDVVIAE